MTERRGMVTERSPNPDYLPMVRVVLRAGAKVSRVGVWAGTRTQTRARLVTGWPYYSAGPHFLDEARTRWMPSFALPLGEVVTTARGREPGEGTLFLVSEAGLEPLGYDAAWDRIDPACAADRAAQREHDARAAKAGLPRELTRFVGAHGLRDGIHPIAESFYFAERCTARQAFWRRATRAEIEALGKAAHVRAMDPCM